MYTELDHLKQTLIDSESMLKTGKISKQEFESSKKSIQKRRSKILNYGPNSCRQKLASWSPLATYN